MANPVIADNKPIPVDVVEGEVYFYCTCGRSASQPFCDGSHAGTEFQPLRYTAEKTGKVAMCRCKLTNRAPFCDATHKEIDAEQVGKEASDRSD